MGLSNEEKQLIVKLHERGFKNTSIAEIMRRHVNTIYLMIKKFKKGTLYTSKPSHISRGTPSIRKLTAQQTLNVLKYFAKNPFDTYRQCIKRLHLPVTEMAICKTLKRNKWNNFVACEKNFISLQNQIKRLKFALKYRHWTTEWFNVQFMDEKTVQTYGSGKVLVKRKRGERYDSEKMHISEKQNTRNKVNLFGMVSYNGPNTIYSVSTKLTANEVTQLMRKEVLKHIDSTVLMDNASIHSQCMEFLARAGKTVIDFPPKSNDMNVIENIWGRFQKNLNLKLLNFTVSTQEQLLKLIEKSWKDVPADFIRKCILSMPRRLEEVIKMQGKQTRF